MEIARFQFYLRFLVYLMMFSAIFWIGVSEEVRATDAIKQYQNPVFEPVFADPSIVRGEDGYFYAYGTEDDWGDGKGGHLIPIIRSKDLVSWEFMGDAFKTKPTWKEDGGLWAPDIVHYNNKYYLYYSFSLWGDMNPGIGVAVAEHPAGPFKDLGLLFTSEEIGVGNSIDPMFFLDDDGTPYLFWGSFHGIYGIELAKDGLKTVGEKFRIAGLRFEASYIIKRNGYYYYFGSIGSCCEGAASGYHVGVGRSQSIKGPYADKNDVDLLFSEGSLILMGNQLCAGEGKEFAGTGHNAIITDDRGQDWIIYHAVDTKEPFLPNGATRRPLMLDPLVWSDGWPMVEELVPSNVVKVAPYVKW